MSDAPDLPRPLLPDRPEGFDVFYAGTPPWDIGAPQPVFADLARSNALRGRVLDVGCGTGEHALLAASLGHDTVGVDAAPTAIERARAKAGARELDAAFITGDVLDLPALVQGTFDTIIDSALFHVFSDDDRVRYAAALAAVAAPAARYFMLCFSDAEPGTEGPRRVSEHEIRATFSSGWTVDSVQPATLVTVDVDVRAWLAVVTRA